jgi:glycosyltransferase involved in cell wall biosynthesis
VRIAYVIPAHPPAFSQPFVVNEMIEVQEAGHDVYVVPLYSDRTTLTHGTFDRFRPVAVFTPALFDVRMLAVALRVLVTHPVRVVRTLVSAHCAAGRNFWAHAKLLAVTPKALATVRWLRAAHVDRIHAHFANQTADCAAIASAVSGIPFSFTAHAYDIYSRAPRLRNDTLAWKLGRAAQVFAVSTFAAGRLRALLPAADRGRVHTAYVGIPLDLFRPRTPQPRDGALRLLTVARLVETKGLDTLLDAAALLRGRGVDFQLRVLGDGPLREALAAAIARLGVGDVVVLAGSVPQEAVAREMDACHAVVLPCRADRFGDMDGIPTVFMEALATGRPVISTPISGIPELVRDGETGLLVPPDDARALADAIERLAVDDELRGRLGREGRALVERQHDQRANARRLVALMDGFRPGAPAAAASPAASVA